MFLFLFFITFARKSHPFAATAKRMEQFLEHTPNLVPKEFSTFATNTERITCVCNMKQTLAHLLTSALTLIMVGLGTLGMSFLCVPAEARTGHFIPSSRFSSSLISNLCQDRQGFVWVATDYGLNRFDGYQFETFLHDDADTTSLLDNVVTRLLCDAEGRLWVGTNHGLDRFDPASASFVHYPIPHAPRITSLLQRCDGTLLIGTAGYGAYVMDSLGHISRFTTDAAEDYSIIFYEDTRGRLWRTGFDERVTLRSAAASPVTFTMPQGRVVSFVEQGGELFIVCQHGIATWRDGAVAAADVDMSLVTDEDIIFTKALTDGDGNIIICTRGRGIYRIAPQRPARLEPVEVDASGMAPATAKVVAAMFDRDGNLWLGCERKGLLMVPRRPVRFHSWSFENQGIRLGSTVSSACEGDDGIIWCTVQGVGVYGFDRQGRVVAHPKAPAAAEFIFRDPQHRYWVGTDDGLFSYDPLSGSSRQAVSYECDKFNDMTADAQGNLYISTFSQGFCVYNPRTGHLRNHNIYEERDSLHGRLCNNWVMRLATDHRGLIWLATSSGVACYSPTDDSFRPQGRESLLRGTMCYDVCELRAGKLPDGRMLGGCMAIGTEHGLYLYDPQRRQAEPFPGSEELANKVVSSIIQDAGGDIWCSTSNGIWQYSLSAHAFTGHAGAGGLPEREYIYGVGLHTADDRICFGQAAGLTVFAPRDIVEDRAPQDSLHLTAFRAAGQDVKAGTVINGVEVTSLGVSQTDRFTLSYLDHTVSMTFSQFDFAASQGLMLEYRIDGDNWMRRPEGENEITLAHLQPGTYHIEVRACQGGACSPVKRLTVVVRAPWYRSTTAYIVYFLLLAALLFVIFRTMHRRADERLSEEKMKFLINTTHDIRSPLTLIMSPLANLRRRIGDNQPDAQRDLQTIEQGAQRILDLVNQILDVRKIDKQQMHLHCSETDLVTFVEGICKMFDYPARERGITFLYPHDEGHPLMAWIDRRQMDKVVSNLLSNAFKYTFDGGTIELRLSLTDEQTPDGPAAVRLQVIDDGAGLDTDTAKHIFDRFYQGSNARRLNIDGTGIGLNLCKMIVDMHHGTIDAANRSDGNRGSVFTVHLPLGTSHLAPEEIDQDDDAQESAEEQTATDTRRSHTKYRVLLVDDDMEVARYISQELGRYYLFGLAPNGKEALRLLLTGDYDVVVSDVMMPEMDGFTLLRMIKTNVNISHLPVIMLTSKADVANRLEGLERGADAFLAKPFDMEELRMNIENCISTVRRLRGKFSGAQQQAGKIEAPQVRGNDEELMERIMKVVNRHLGDSEFTVDQLTQEACISRTQLHRKMKELTGLSTSEFIRNLRLEQAARLLKEQKINVTQVAYTVGFSNVAHFSSLFHRHFGMTPTAYSKS